MAKIEHSIDINVPVREAYDQWTQFETFPQFMEGVESVRQLDETHLHWVATVGGQRKEWDAEITEQTPDQRIAWTSTTGDHNAGAVNFHRLGEERTRVTLTMDIQPSGPVEAIGTAVGIPSGQVKGDLDRFRDFIERRGTATGGWRGEVEQGDVTGSRDDARELAGAGAMGSYGAGSAFDTGTAGSTYDPDTAPAATADDPYGLGTDPTATPGAGRIDEDLPRNR
jgi:hypothetical protein